MSVELSVQVSRITGGPLELNDGVEYAIVGIDPGDVSPIVTYEESPVSNGAVPVRRKYPMGQARMTVRCYGANADACLAKKETVRAAFSQWGYTVTIVTGGYTDVLHCTYAAVSAPWDATAFNAGWIDVEVLVPRQP